MESCARCMTGDSIISYALCNVLVYNDGNGIYLSIRAGTPPGGIISNPLEGIPSCEVLVRKNEVVRNKEVLLSGLFIG